MKWRFETRTLPDNSYAGYANGDLLASAPTEAECRKRLVDIWATLPTEAEAEQNEAIETEDPK